MMMYPFKNQLFTDRAILIDHKASSLIIMVASQTGRSHSSLRLIKEKEESSRPFFSRNQQIENHVSSVFAARTCVE